MKKILIVLFFLISSHTLMAETAYPCNGCNETEYKQVAEQHDGDVYVYDLDHNNLRRYIVTDIRECEVFIGYCWTLQTAVEQVPSYQMQQDFSLLHDIYTETQKSNVVRMDLEADQFVPTSPLSEFNAYDVLSQSSARNVVQDFLHEHLQNTVWDDKAVENALKVLNGAVSKFLGSDIVLVIVVEYKDGSKSVFRLDKSSNGLRPELDRENTENQDADRNQLVQNNSESIGLYEFSNESNLTDFLMNAFLQGVSITEGGRSRRLSCHWDEETSTLTCIRH